MADEELLAELAEVSLRATRGYDYISTKTMRMATEAALAWLAERGRLVDDGAQVEEQWGVRFTCETDGQADEKRVQDRGDAEGWIADHRQEAAQAAERGEVWTWRPSLIRRQVVTGPWVAVDEETT